jgi:conjugation system TraG family ATPase
MLEVEKIFPLFKVEQQAIVSMHGDITVGFEVTLPEIFSLSDADYENLHHAWVRAIRLLPYSTVFHKQDWFTTGAFRADFQHPDAELLTRSSERFFNERPRLDHRCYIYLTKKPSGRKPSSSGYANLLRRSIVPPQMLDTSFYQDFLSYAGQFVRVLTDSGLVSLKRLTNEQLAGSANMPGVMEQYCFLLNPDQHSFIQDIHLKDHIHVGDKKCQIFALSDAQDLPSLCGPRRNYDKYSTDSSKFSIGFAASLGNLLNCNHIYNQYLFIEDPAKTIKQLEAKKLRLQSLSAYSRENSIGRDACNDFLNEAISTQRMPVKAHFNVLTWTTDSTELPELKNKVGSAMASMDVTCRQETDGAPQIWFSGMPGNQADFPMNDTFDTFLEQSACFFNQETNYRSSPSPFGIRLGDRLSGNPLHVDISDEPVRLGYITNRNKFIIGPSGSGKSFFTNHMVHAYYLQGTHVVLVDVGHSYKGLCELVGGYYFTYTEEKPICFNPFYIGSGDVLDTEKKESIKTLLLALWKKDDETYRRSEYVAISNALTLYYEFLAKDAAVFPCFNSFYEFLMEQYQDVLLIGKVKERNFDIDNFLYVLNPYYKGGEFDYLLNASAQLDVLNERFIVYEIDSIKDHPILFPVVTLIIMELFISKMRKLKGLRKMILIEECWKAIAKEGMAEYIKYLFKTVRKFYGEAVVVTQEIEDIISSPVVKQAIINNSDCKILLDQSKYQHKFDAVQQLLGLTDEEKAQVLSLNRANDPLRKYKEVFISLGGQYSRVYRTEVSLEEYLAYTTEESEKLKVQAYANQYGSISKGISMLARDMRGNKST